MPRRSPGQEERYWTGEGQLSFQGKQWTGGLGIQLSDVTTAIGAPSRRMTASFAVVNRPLRLALLDDPGPLQVEIQWLFSKDAGKSWTAIGSKFVGRLSTPKITNGVYTVELETYTGDIDRGKIAKWSHERQMSRTAAVDRGMEMSNDLEVGIESKWPP